MQQKVERKASGDIKQPILEHPVSCNQDGHRSFEIVGPGVWYLSGL